MIRKGISASTIRHDVEVVFRSKCSHEPSKGKTGGLIPCEPKNRGYVPGAKSANGQNHGYVPDCDFANRHEE